MPLPVYRLRRLLAAIAILLTLAVAGMYFYARSKALDAIRTVPGKIGYDIKQTAQGFQISKSDGKRTLFTVQASNVKEFKLNGNAELHNVSIILYGRDSSRFDQIYGDDFSYNQKTGDVTATGDVQIDLVSNPAGLSSPDQSAPKELKNPIHLKTRDLVFNKNTGDASTPARVEFQTPQAMGWAVGVNYAGKTNTLTLSSEIHLVLNRPHAAVVEAQHGVITGDPRQVVLDLPHLTRAAGNMHSDRAVFYLNRDNQVERVVATGSVTTQVGMLKSQASARNSANGSQEPASEIHGHSDEAVFLLQGDEDLLHTATLRGNVHFEQTGAASMQGEAGRVIVDFAGQNQVQKVHALDGARIAQSGAESEKTAQKGGTSAPQDFELTAPIIDFTVAEGRVLRHATTSGAAQIRITQTGGAPASPAPSSPPRTVVTAGKFDADFAEQSGRNALSTIHGAPDARIVSTAAGHPDRISTSDSVDAIFLTQGGIESVTQRGNFVYTDGQPPDKQMRAWATTAHYTPADQMLVLSGSPRISSGGMASTASSVRINRGTGEALAEGDVKTSY